MWWWEEVYTYIYILVYKVKGWDWCVCLCVVVHMYVYMSLTPPPKMYTMCVSHRRAPYTYLVHHPPLSHSLVVTRPQGSPFGSPLRFQQGPHERGLSRI